VNAVGSGVTFVTSRPGASAAKVMIVSISVLSGNAFMRRG